MSLVEIKCGIQLRLPGNQLFEFPFMLERPATLRLIIGQRFLVVFDPVPIPAWFTPGSGQDVISFPVFALSTTAAAILFTWLYNNTGGSLPLVILAHTVFDLCTTGPWSGALFTLPPDQRGLDPFNILTVVVLAVAVAVVLVTDRRTLTRRPSDAISPTSRGSRAAAE